MAVFASLLAVVGRPVPAAAVPPLALPDIATVVTGSTTTIDVLANDVDVLGGELTVAEITEPPVEGTATIASGGDAVQYVAPATATAESFTYRVENGAGESSTAVVSVTAVPGGIEVNALTDGVDDDPGDGACSTGAVLGDGRAECTLRAAIEEANALAGVQGVALPSGSLAWASEILVTDDLVLSGVGDSELTGTLRVTGSAALTVERVRLTGRITGVAGIGPLIVRDSEIVPVAASGLDAPGDPLRIERSTVDGVSVSSSGRVIDVADSTLVDVVISGTGEVAIARSSLSANSQASVSGQFRLVDSSWLSDFRAVLVFDGATAEIDNSTLVTPRGVEVQSGGEATVRSSTIDATQYGVRSLAGATVSVSDSIVVGGTQGCIGTITLTSVLNDDGTCGSGPLVGVDPLLGPLQDNGGPTSTRAPLAGSPAIDAATGTCPATDQRGETRPRDGDGDGAATCDIGAVEVETLVAACPSETVAIAELRAAIGRANDCIGIQEITVLPGSATVPTGGALTVTDALIIRGDADVIPVLQSSRTFLSVVDSSLELQDLAFEIGGGFGIVNSRRSDVVLTNISFEGDPAIGCNVSTGPAVYVDAGSLVMRDSEIADPACQGVVGLFGATLDIADSVFRGGGNGGIEVSAAASLDAARLEIHGQNFDGVRSANTDTVIEIRDSVIYGTGGDGVDSRGEVSMTDVTIGERPDGSPDGNAAMGVRIGFGSLDLERVRIVHNDEDGINLSSPSSVVISETTIANNGGAGLRSGSAYVIIDGSFVGANAPDCSLFASTIDDRGGNADGDGTCGFDSPYQLTAGDVSIAEGGGTLDLVVGLDRPADGEVVTPIGVAATSTADGDDATVPTSLTFADGSTSSTLSIPITDDPDVEPNETLDLTFGPVGAEPGPTALATVTIEDDDAIEPVDVTLALLRDLVGEPVTVSLPPLGPDLPLRIQGEVTVPGGTGLGGFTVHSVFVDGTIDVDGFAGTITAQLDVPTFDVSVPIAITVDGDGATAAGGPVPLAGIPIGPDPAWLEITAGSASVSFTAPAPAGDPVGEVRVDGLAADVLPATDGIDLTVVGASGVITSDGEATLTAPTIAGSVDPVAVTFSDVTLRLSDDATVPFFEADEGAAGVFGLDGLRVYRDGTFEVTSFCATEEAGLLGSANVGGLLPVEVTRACVTATDPDGTRTIDIDGWWALASYDAEWPGGVDVTLDGEPIVDGAPLSISVRVAPSIVAPGAILEPVDLPEVRIVLSGVGAVDGVEGTLEIVAPEIVGRVAGGAPTATFTGSVDRTEFTADLDASLTGTLTVVDAALGAATLSLAGELAGSAAVPGWATLDDVDGSLELALTWSGGLVSAVDVSAADVSFAGTADIPLLLGGSGEPLRFSGSFGGEGWTFAATQTEAVVGALALTDFALTVTVDDTSVAASGTATAELAFDGDADDQIIGEPLRVSVGLESSGDGAALVIIGSVTSPSATFGEVLDLTNATASVAIALPLAGGFPFWLVTVGADSLVWDPVGDGTVVASLTDATATMAYDGTVRVDAAQLVSSAFQEGVVATIDDPILDFGSLPQTTPVFSASSSEISAVGGGITVTLDDVAIYRDGAITIGGGCLAAADDLLGAVGLGGLLPIDVTSACVIANGSDGSRDVALTGSWDLDDGLSPLPGLARVLVGGAEVVDGDPFAVSVRVAPGIVSPIVVTPVDLPAVTIELGDPLAGALPVAATIDIPAFLDGERQGDVTVAIVGGTAFGGTGGVILVGGATLGGSVDPQTGTGLLTADATFGVLANVDGLLREFDVTGSVDVALSFVGGRLSAAAIAPDDVALRAVLDVGLSDGDGDPLELTGTYAGGTWTFEVAGDVGVDGIEVEDLTIRVAGDADGVAVSGSGELVLALDGDGDGAVGTLNVPIAVAGGGGVVSLTASGSLGDGEETVSFGDVFDLDSPTFAVDLTASAAGVVGGSATIGANEATWFPDLGTDGLATLVSPVLTIDPTGTVVVTASSFTADGLLPGVEIAVADPTLTFSPTVPQVAPVFSAASAEIVATDAGGSVTVDDLSIFRDGTVQIGSACVDTALEDFPLAGVLPFVVTEACATAVSPTRTDLAVTGYFDLDDLGFPFTPTVTYGGVPVIGGEQEEVTVVVAIDPTDPVALPQPVLVEEIGIGFDDLDILDSVASGAITIPAWTSLGVSQSISGTVDIVGVGVGDVVTVSGSATIDGTITIDGAAASLVGSVALDAAGSIDPIAPLLLGSIGIDLRVDGFRRVDEVDVSFGLAVAEVSVLAAIEVPGLDAADPLVAGLSYADGDWVLLLSLDEATIGGFTARDLVFRATVDEDGDLTFSGGGALDVNLGGDAPVEVSLTVGGSQSSPTFTVDAELGRLDLGPIAITDPLDGDGSATPDVSISVTANLSAVPPTATVDAEIDLERVVIVPDDAAATGGLVVIEGVSGSLTPAGVTLAIDDATITAFDRLRFELSATDGEPAATLRLGPGDGPILTVDTIRGSLLDEAGDPLLTLTATDIEVAADGSFSLASVTVTDEGLGDLVGIGGVLPVALSEVEVVLPEADRDLEVRARGTIDLSLLGDLPGDPYVRIGDVELSEGDTHGGFDVGLRFSEDDDGNLVVVPVGFGDVVLGVENLALGPLALDARISISSAEDAPAVVTAAAAIRGAADGISGEFEIAATGVVTTTATGGNLALDLTFGLSATLIEDFVEIEGLAGSVGIDFGIDLADPELTVDFRSVGPITYESLTLGFEDLMSFTAAGGSLDVLAGPGETVVRFEADESVGVTFGEDLGPLGGWSGSVGGFEIRNGTAGDPLPRVILLPGFSVDIEAEGNLLLPEQIPFGIDNIGFSLPGVGEDGLDLREELTGDVDLLEALAGDLTNFRVNFTGGFDKDEAEFWPITATVDDLELDLAILKRWLDPVDPDYSELPIIGLNGAEFVMDEVPLGPISLGGGFGLGVVVPDEENGLTAPIWYGRVLGDFGYGSFGFGVELILSQYGPIAGRLEVPLSIPLGPSTFLISGASGSIEFDGSATPKIDTSCFALDGCESLEASFRNVQVGDVNLTNEQIEQKLIETHALFAGFDDTKVLEETAKRFASGFNIAVSGQLTQAALIGVVEGQITLGANISLDLDGFDDNNIQLIGQGTIEIYGMAVGDAKIVLDYSEPLDPVFTIGLGVPRGGDILSAIVPGEATLVATFDTGGLWSAGFVTLRYLFEALLDPATSQETRDAFGPVVDEFAAYLDENRSTRVAMILIGDEPEPETIDTEWVLTRLVGGPTPLLPLDASSVDAETGELIGALLADLFRFASRLPGTDSGAAFQAAFIDLLADLLTGTAVATLDAIDPKLVVSGTVQPKLLGIPLGDPLAQVAFTLDKNTIGFQASGAVRDMLTASMAFCIACAVAFDVATLGAIVRDDTTISFRADNPFDLADLIEGGDFPPLDPFIGEWVATIDGDLNVAGFTVGAIDGLLVPGSTDGQNPQVDALAADPRIDVPVAVADHLREFGGLFVNGDFQLPRLLVDPANVIKELEANGPFPQDDPLAIVDWITGQADLLDDAVNVGGFQGFVPGPDSQDLVDTMVELGDLVASDPEAIFRDDLLDSNEVQAFGELFADAYLRGDLDVDLLGMPTVGGTIRLGSNEGEGVVVEADFPFIPGVVELGAAIVSYPGDGSRETLWPAIGGERTFTTEQAGELVALLGLDASLFQATGEATVRAYSPGFDPEGTDLQRRGGIEIEVLGTIPGIVENAIVVFTLTPPTSGGLPDFTAVASATEVTIAGFTVDNPVVGLRKQGRSIIPIIGGAIDEPFFAGSVTTDVDDGTYDFTGTIRVPGLGVGGSTAEVTAIGTIGADGSIDISTDETTLSAAGVTVSGRLRVDRAAGESVEVSTIGTARLSVAGFADIAIEEFRVAGGSSPLVTVTANVSIGADPVALSGMQLTLERLNSWRLALSGGQLELFGVPYALDDLDSIVVTGPSVPSEIAVSTDLDLSFALGAALRVDDAVLRVTGNADELSIDQIGTASATVFGGIGGFEMDDFSVSSNGTVDGEVSGELTVAGVELAEADFALSRSGGVWRADLDVSTPITGDIGGAGNIVPDFSTGGFDAGGGFDFTSDRLSLWFPAPGTTDLLWGGIEGTVRVHNPNGVPTVTFDGEACRPGLNFDNALQVDLDRLPSLDDTVEFLVDLFTDQLACEAITLDVSSNGVVTFFVPMLGNRSFPPLAPVIEGDPGQAPEFGPVEPVQPISVPASSAVGSGDDVRYPVEFTPPTAGGETVTCVPASGSLLRENRTNVQCSAANGPNIASVYFDVDVVPYDDTPIVVLVGYQATGGGTTLDLPVANFNGDPIVEKGQTGQARGENATPGDRVRGTVFSDPIVVGETVVGPDGTWTLDYVIPEDLAVGPHTLDVAVISPGGTTERVQVPIEVVEAGAAYPVCTITGTDGPDLLFGTNGDDVICGFGGDDLIFGFGGDDIIDAGGGDDVVFGGWGDDTIRGGDGDDALFGGPGADEIDGGPGRDLIRYGSGRWWW
ncbi:MAG: choice-of-anchor Q domain-containing protein [Actinomycetota bacterium]